MVQARSIAFISDRVSSHLMGMFINLYFSVSLYSLTSLNRHSRDHNKSVDLTRSQYKNSFLMLSQNYVQLENNGCRFKGYMDIRICWDRTYNEILNFQSYWQTIRFCQIGCILKFDSCEKAQTSSPVLWRLVWVLWKPPRWQTQTVAGWSGSPGTSNSLLCYL